MTAAASDGGLQQIKQALKNTWMSGDFGKIAEHSAKEAERFVGALVSSRARRYWTLPVGRATWQFQPRGPARKLLAWI